MSWDVVILAAPSAASLDDLPRDFDPSNLGPAEDVRSRLRDALPELDLSDPAWGSVAGPTWGIELGIGADDPVEFLSLAVRGSGDDVLPVIGRIAAAVGGRALDCSTSAFLTGDPAETTGWHGFQDYRDRIVGRD
jgi:hypothetical protein